MIIEVLIQQLQRYTTFTSGRWGEGGSFILTLDSGSVVNLITKPPMSVQVMIYPPSGMSVTGSEFVTSGAGIYTTTYTLNPGDGKDIEVHIKSNQVGDFNVKRRIVYYFGKEKDKAEDQTLNLPIKVRKEAGQTAPLDSTPKTPGFAGELAISGILFVLLLIKQRK
jgi:hypothetical protein